MLKRILIAAVVAGALALAYVAATHRQARQAGAARDQARLLTFDDRAVTGLTLTSGGTDWSFTRHGETWRLVRPVTDAADAAKVTAVIHAARRASVVQTVTSPDALASYGLDPPVASLRIEGPPVPVLDVGTPTPARDGVYVRVRGRPGVLVAGLPEAEPLLHANPFVLRDASWIGLEANAISALAIEGNGVRLSLARRGGSWWIETPRRLPAAGVQVERLVKALAGTRVVAIDDRATPSDPKLGLGRGAMHIDVTAEGTTRRLVLGALAEPGHRFATSDARGTVLVVDAKPWEAAPKDLATLRDPRLTDINRYTVVAFDYDAGGAQFAATRAADKTWHASSGASLEAGNVYALLVAALEARTTGFAAGTPAGTPTARLSVTLEDGTKSRIDFFRGPRATWDALPGTVFDLAAPPPSVPPQK